MEDRIEEGLDIYGWITYQLEYEVSICENLLCKAISLAYKAITDEIIDQIIGGRSTLPQKLSKARIFIAGLIKEIGALFEHFILLNIADRAVMSYKSMRSMRRIVDFLDFFRLNPNLPSISVFE